MKKMFVLVAALMISVMVCGGAMAADLKIGIVDLYKALNESESGKKAKTELESFAKSKQSGLEDKARTIERLRGELEKQGSVLSKDARKSKEEELERVTRDAQRLAADAQTEFRKKENELTGGVLKDIRVVINDIAKEEKYTLILERADGLVLFADNAIDLTDKVIKKFNASGKK
ncbi:MAG TPA: OmpH family outer membrane protein [Dissulfurispiraceae bacterium]|nr:OmpH family outer membrane protein [Dissulfurispiraceae bacterium]